MKNKNFFVFVVSFVILAVDVYLYFLPEKNTPLNYFYNTLYSIPFFIGAFIGVLGAVKMSLKSSLGRALFFLGLAEASYGIGLLVWSYFNLVKKIEIPYPSTADLFFLLFIPLAGYGVFQFFRIIDSFKPRLILEGLAILTISLVFMIGFVSKPDLSSDLPTLTKIFNTLYPAGDSILITLVYVSLRVVSGKIQKSLIILVVAFLFQIAADYIFSYRTTHNLYWNGDIADTLYTLSATTLTLALISIYDSFVTPEAEVLV